MMRRTSSTAVALVAAGVFAALTSCSSDSSDGSAAEARPGVSGSGSPSTGPTPAPTPTPTEPARPSPSPTGPCADGTCETEVAVGDVVTVPAGYGLGPIEVTAITGDGVELAAPLTGSGYSVSGCSGGGGVSSAGGGGVELRCGPGTVATVNDAMSLEVVEIRDTAAVLRIEPAG